MPAGLHRTYGALHLHFITTSCYQRRPLFELTQARDHFLSILEEMRQRYRFAVEIPAQTERSPVFNR
jgi:REP element-mobilizing transposase RayT